MTVAAAHVEDAFTVHAADGTTLFVQRWGVNKPGGRVLFIVHGVGEHGGRYAHLHRNMSEVFDEVYAMDLRGHGRSAGIRGYAASVDVMLDDIKAVAADVRRRTTVRGKPAHMYLLGHSMGGLLGLRYLQRERAHIGFERAFISAPFLGLSMKVPGWKESLGRVLAKTLSKVQLHNDINPSHISHDPAVVEAYVNDRLVHSKMTPRLYFDLMAAIELVKGDTAPLPCPTLFLVPTDDKLVDSSATLSFLSALKDRNKSLKQYEGFYHEVLNEVRKDQVFADMKDWVKQGDVVSAST